MRVLILEDDLERRKLFSRALRGVSIIMMVDCPDMCIDLLGKSQWDVLFLDHDLGGKAYTPSDDSSGYKVAEWLAGNPNHMPGKVFIHTMNGAGADNMARALPDAIRAPFSLLIANLLEETTS
jgi:CheY-like chemotaxis protein